MANKRNGNVKIPELFLLFKTYILLLGRSSLQTYFFISFTPTQGSLLIPKMEFFIKLIFEVLVFYKYAKLSFF